MRAILLLAVLAACAAPTAPPPVTASNARNCVVTDSLFFTSRGVAYAQPVDLTPQRRPGRPPAPPRFVISDGYDESWSWDLR